MRYNQIGKIIEIALFRPKFAYLPVYRHLSYSPSVANKMQDPHYYWKGNSIEEIYRGVGAYEFPALPTIQYSDTHKVLFELPINTGEDEPPKPHAGKRKWDSDHVRMPYAEQNTMEIDGEVSVKEI